MHSAPEGIGGGAGTREGGPCLGTQPPAGLSEHNLLIWWQDFGVTEIFGLRKMKALVFGLGVAGGATGIGNTVLFMTPGVR